MRFNKSADFGGKAKKLHRAKSLRKQPANRLKTPERQVCSKERHAAEGSIATAQLSPIVEITYVVTMFPAAA